MKMKIMVAALCGGMLVAGCSTSSSRSVEVKPSSAGDRIKVTIDPDLSVRITNVSVSQQNGELKVTGRLRPKSFMVRTAGHIHVNFIGLDGAAIQHLTVEPSGSVFFRRNISVPRFRASAALAASEVSEIRLKHHDTPIAVCSYGVGTGR